MGAALSQRELILTRVRDALGAAVPESAAEIVRAYDRSEEAGVSVFVERIEEYGSVAIETSADSVSHWAGDLCARRGTKALVVPEGVPEAWWPLGVEILRESDVDLETLDGVGGVLTGCALAIASTGTIVLDHGRRQGMRRTTLVPDHHICVVESDQVVPGVPAAFVQIGVALRAGRPVTFVSGPSATSDIEFVRVEGVHGPRTLDVLIVSV